MTRKRPSQRTALIPVTARMSGTTADLAVSTAAGPDALASFLRRSRPWRDYPVPLAGRVTTALWSLTGVVAVVAAWLTAVLRGRSRCSGPLCATATLGGHPDVTLVLAVACLAGLLALAVLTRGFRRAGAAQLAGIAVAGVLGLVSVTGVLMVLVLVALALALLVVMLLGITAAS